MPFICSPEEQLQQIILLLRRHFIKKVLMRILHNTNTFKTRIWYYVKQSCIIHPWQPPRDEGLAPSHGTDHSPSTPESTIHRQTPFSYSLQPGLTTVFPLLAPQRACGPNIHPTSHRVG